MHKPNELYVPEFFDRRHEESYRSAQKILAHLWRFYKPRSVVDFGCGTGAWLRAAHELGASELVGLDGDWMDPSYFKNTFIKFLPLSLEEPVSLDQKYDLAISVEVIEHLRPERGDSFVGDLCQAADVVIFSGAIPGQGGINHVNERWHSHWVETFARFNFGYLDVFRGTFWNDQDVAPWYRQNAFLFFREGCRHLLKLDRVAGAPPIDVVHPEIYQSVPRADLMSGRAILKALPHALMRRWRRLASS